MKYVLVIEDDKSICEILAMYLELIQQECITVSTLEQTVSCLIANGPPSIILLDYILNGQAGVDIIKLLKLGYPSVKVILMTATNNPDEIVKQFHLNGLIKKPFLFEDIDAVLKE